MSVLAKVKLSLPLEREYEAWVVRQMEDYFSSCGRTLRIWAVSPAEEATWPADERLETQGKLVGLQFKRAKADSASGGDDLHRIRWSFASPPGQFLSVQKRPEIFYCLPTFVNREWQKASLHHCLFWRPQTHDAVNHNAWYDNPAAHTPYGRLSLAEHAYRWGQFYEALSSCRLGIKVGGSNQTLSDYLLGLREEWPRNSEEVIADPDAQGERALYLAFMPVS